MNRLLFVSALAVTSVALAQTPEPRQFMVTAKVGQAYRYRLNVKMKLDDGQSVLAMSANISEKFVGARGPAQSWSYTFDMTNAAASGLLKPMGNTFQSLDKFSFTREADRYNQTLAMTMNNQSLGSATGPDLVFPHRPIVAGDSWKAKADINGQKLDMTFHFDGYGKYAQKPAARFTGTFDPNPLVESLEPHTFYVDLADGKVLHSRGTARITKNGATLNLWFEMIRQ